MNPRRDGKEHCKVIVLRSGKTVEKPVQVNGGENNAEMKKTVLEMVKTVLKLLEAMSKMLKTILELLKKAMKLLKNSASKEQRKVELKAS